MRPHTAAARRLPSPTRARSALTRPQPGGCLLPSFTMRSSSPPGSGRGALGFERTLWAAADKLRNNVDAGEYKRLVLGLVFLKFISANDGGAFVVPEEARWSALSARAKGAL